MKIYIFADMEGVSGISGSSFVLSENANYQLGRKMLTQDINACVKGCFKAGATEVIVCDGHCSGTNILWEELDPRVELIQGCGYRERFPGIAGSAGLILLGYHAMAGTFEALLEHSYSSREIQNIWLNGKKVGELGLDASIAADKGIPVIMTSGDDKLCEETQLFHPEIITCEVKKGLGCQSARMLSAVRAHELIEKKTVEAIKKIKTIKPPKIKFPVTLRIEKVERGSIPNRDNVKLVDGRTYEAVGRSAVEDAYKKLFYV
ncbi:MAG: M55 family metallopeptidase [Victivallaceae bacterium]